MLVLVDLFWNAQCQHQVLHINMSSYKLNTNTNNFIKLKLYNLWNGCTSPNRKYLIFLACLNCIKSVFMELWKIKIINVVLVDLNTHKNIVKVFSSSPYLSGNDCGKLVNIKIEEECDKLNFT